MMLNGRRRSVLSALVWEYVRSVQPVASKALVERYALGCSPATVRSELAALEETGHVFQPHISAGRIPTDHGYREYVDSLSPERPAGGLSGQEVALIRNYYRSLEREVSEVMRDTAALLANLTSCVAVVAAPTLRRARIRRVSVVPMGGTHATVVVVTNTGQVASRHADLGTEVGATVLGNVEELLAAALEDRVAEEVRSFRESVATAPSQEMAVAVKVLDEVVECLLETDEDLVYHGGVSGLLMQPEFADAEIAGPLLQLLEDGFTLLRLLQESRQHSDVTVRIGHENAVPALGRVSVVATGYRVGDTGGIVGVIGPTRMDYARTINAVRCVSESLQETLGS